MALFVHLVYSCPNSVELCSEHTAKFSIW